jgi:hypothetical protein
MDGAAEKLQATGLMFRAGKLKTFSKDAYPLHSYTSAGNV